MTEVNPPGRRRAQRGWFPRLQILGVGLLTAGIAQAAPLLGMVSDNNANLVNIFNADRDVVTAIHRARPGLALGDCAMVSDGSIGFTSSNANEITILDLANREDEPGWQLIQVPISNLGVDMALSPDDTLLVVAGGGSLQQPLSVVDVELGAEVSTSGPFVDHTSVDFCDNGTLLVTTSHGESYGRTMDNALYDVRVDADGRMELKGHRLSSGKRPNNAVCAPGSLTGVLLDREGGLTSFTMPELEPADFAQLDASAAVAAVFSRDGGQLFVRTRYSVQAYDFDPASGDMSPAWQRRLAETSTYFGIEQIAMHPEGNKLYVDGGGPLLILEPRTGRQVGGMDIGDTTGICFANLVSNPLGPTVSQN